MLSLEALYTNKGGNGRKGIILEDNGKMKVPKFVAHLEYILHLSLEIVPFPRPQREN